MIWKKTGGELYCGITLKWNYAKENVDIVMPTYLQKQLVKYRHNTPKQPEYCPYAPAAVQYGRKSQEVPVEEESKLLDKEGKLRVQ